MDFIRKFLIGFIVSGLSLAEAVEKSTVDDLEQRLDFVIINSRGEIDTLVDLNIQWVTDDLEKRERFLRVYLLAEDVTNAKAQYNLGCYYNGFDDVVARNEFLVFSCFKFAAQYGLPLAQYNLAFLYSKGIGTPRNVEKALEWLKKAAESNEPFFLSSYASFLINHPQKPEHRIKGMRFLLELSLHTYVSAQRALGEFLMKLGSQIFDQGKALLIESAMNKNQIAQNNLAIITEHSCVVSDIRAANFYDCFACQTQNDEHIRHLKTLAQNGDSVAQNDLGIMLLRIGSRVYHGGQAWLNEAVRNRTLGIGIL
ncbi:MAG: sel1 repeat family protein [Candidatus Paracaedibacteraceae bacterium]|nr:sel1 repeat family protein [Candidatus Paracaedibacteraceae bacterium]